MRVSKPAHSLSALALTSLLALPSLLSGCAGNPDQELTLEQRLAKQNYTLGKTVDRIEDYRIMGFNSIDDFHVIIHSSPSRSYLVTVRTRCHNLDTAETLAFSTTVGSVTDKDKLLVRSAAAGFTEECYIDSMQELSKVQPS